jgi:hypothetical protein
MANAYASAECSTGFARRTAAVDIARIDGQCTCGNSVGSVAPGSGPAPCLPEQYRPNPAIFDIAIGKLYTWPKDIGSIKRLGCRHRLAALLPLMVPMQMIASNNAGQW